MEGNLDTSHSYQGPHRPFLELPEGFVGLRLAMHPEGMVLELDQPHILIGRHSEAQVRLPSPEVSRRHCRLYFRECFWRVQDLSSLNGIYINDEKIAEGTLYEGDVLRVGDFVFRVSYVPGTTPRPQDQVIQSIADVLPRRAS